MGGLEDLVGRMTEEETMEAAQYLLSQLPETKGIEVIKEYLNDHEIDADELSGESYDADVALKQEKESA